MDELKTDVALIKKDIKLIERYFGRFDSALESMADMSERVAVQGEMLKNCHDKIEDLEEKVEIHKQEDVARGAVMTDRLEQYRISSKEDHQRLSDQNALNRAERNREIMEALAKLNGSLDQRIKDQENRIKGLENWKYYMMGIGAVVIFIAMRIQWPSLFG